MDRCALFVDAGYVLTDGAVAAQGTSQREAVSWDYPGLLQFLAGLAVDRTGLPLLRCYWYEATVDGRRTAEHDTLADLPGLTLRLGRMRPGKREGVETEIHRDLTTLARNRAVSDVLLVSAEDDLAQVIADVQDLGVRVIIVHISVDGNWTVSRALRQQGDDIVEIQGTQLRPYAELTGGEPARYSEQYAASAYGGRSMSNGHSNNAAGGGYSSLPASSAGAHPAPPAIYTAPVVAEYQQPPAVPPVSPSPPTASPSPLTALPRREQPSEPVPAMDNPPEPPARGSHESTIAPGSPSSPSQPNQGIIAQPGQHQPGQHQPGQHQPGQHQASQAQQAQRPATHQLYTAPLAPPAPAAAAPMPAAFHEPPAPAQPVAPAPPIGPAGSEAPAAQSQPHRPGSGTSPSDQRASSPRSPYEGATSTSSFMDPPGGQFPAAPADQFGGASTSLPARRVTQPQAPPGQHEPPPARPQQTPRSPQTPRPAPVAGGGYVPQQAAYGAGSLPGSSLPGSSLPAAPAAAPPPVAPAPSASPSPHTALDSTVQAAHAEGFEFGESVARDAPALWLEAVLARKPRMPTDLEARLLQGSALPIDSLLHDEVRQALRNGFWDALERSRR